jgi:hypothetical protein
LVEEAAPSEEVRASFPVSFATPSTVIISVSDFLLARTAKKRLAHPFHVLF